MKKPLPEDFSYFLDMLAGEKEDNKEQRLLYFDNEPLERILYGKDLPGPTRANLFLEVVHDVEKIDHACRKGDISGALEQICAFVENNYPLSSAACSKFALIARQLVPDYPNALLKHDLSVLGPLLEQIWSRALETENSRMQNTIGPPMYRWYEHNKRYEDARLILKHLIEIHRKQKDHINEAVMINNFAFEYLLEGSWQEALPLFDEAARIFKENNNLFEHANARANYWTCWFEGKNFTMAETSEGELKTIAETFLKNKNWRARKPFILLAQLEERRGNIAESIRLVEKALSACKNLHTRYSQADAEYLEHLKGAL